MHKPEVIQIVLQNRLVAILRLGDLRRASELVRALIRGGVRAIEFTMTNPDTPRVVSELLMEIPEFVDGRAVLGIGSVRSIDEARVAIECGANFLVSPTCLEPVIREAQLAEKAIFPGAFTPTEIALASQWGADIVKVFPAKSLGPDFIRDVMAPMPYLKLMPTGGVHLKNMQSYFQAGAVAVGLGGQFIQSRWLEDENWPQIELAAREATTLACSAGS